MTNTSQSRKTILENHIVRIALGTALILAIPLIAMQFNNDVQWGPEDFVIIGTLLFGAGLIYELIAHRLRTRKQRIIVGVVVALGVMYLWAELAVGIFTNWGS